MARSTVGCFLSFLLLQLNETGDQGAAPAPPHPQHTLFLPPPFPTWTLLCRGSSLSPASPMPPPQSRVVLSEHKSGLATSSKPSTTPISQGGSQVLTVAPFPQRSSAPTLPLSSCPSCTGLLARFLPLGPDKLETSNVWFKILLLGEFLLVFSRVFLDRTVAPRKSTPYWFQEYSQEHLQKSEFFSSSLNLSLELSMSTQM